MKMTEYEIEEVIFHADNLFLILKELEDYRDKNCVSDISTIIITQDDDYEFDAKIYFYQ